MTDLTSHAVDLDGSRSFRWIADGMAFGADYNPEQWPESVWAEDMELMRRAGVTNVSLAIFSWVLIEPSDGVFEWGWLDRMMDMLHEHGIGANLATPTAAPPMWLMRAHPEITTVDELGHRTAAGGRLSWSPSSATFRHYALRMVRELATRYRDHPALRLWHVSNEIGNENNVDYSPEAEAAWQAWLGKRYGGVAGVNQAWGTAFWGHTYGDLSEIVPPHHARTKHNPGLLLDWARFTSDSLLEHFIAEREVLREVTPDTPITTNFMILSEDGSEEYSGWAHEVDVLSNDHYTIGTDPLRHRELEFSADRSRGMAEGRPWLLMEHAANAVNWQQVNRAKEPGEMIRDSLSHIARGADGALFFQWRASTAGIEQWHSGMVPHSGGETRQFREVEALGAALKALAPAQGSVVEQAQVGMLVDEMSQWAIKASRLPTGLLKPLEMGRRIHKELGDRGISVDVVPSGAPLDAYRVIIVPTLYLAKDGVAEQLAQAVEAGAHVLVTFASGIVDETNRVIRGGYPGAFRDLLGMRAEEIRPLFEGETVALDDGTAASIWTELVEVGDADVLRRYAEGALAGQPALTRSVRGAGTATYLSYEPDGAGLEALVDELVELAGVTPVAAVDRGISVTRRVGENGSFLFLINHTQQDLTVDASGVDLITGEQHEAPAVVPAGRVVVLDERS
ncbi:beta-galactosidase [Homoserinibacter sp. GY 40078]|uniref:beta-galactosidase n=1 Tax=Homoserinibacter sp. GY 40078 TaxID=2603275 RepID=UPI0011CBD08E|nr:beta-galactosidase [Homoserinibacter sp. GY 40078]TXK19391.1 beta-galactosidase [Homoserinibacter sp. GY 40078]